MALRIKLQIIGEDKVPIYEYRCDSCLYRFDDLVAMGEATEEKECPRCGKMAPRIFGTFGFVVKGGTSPSRTSAPSNSRPPDAIPIGEIGYAVPRRDKRGRPVKISDIKDPSDLPKDMQKLRQKKRDKHALEQERFNPNRSQI